jgi:eukaryotic-like serine/threonine-protein kinase
MSETSDPGSSDCPERPSVEAFVAGRLPPSERGRIEAHVSSCDSCSRLTTMVLSRGPTEWPEQHTRPSGAGTPAHFPPGRGQTVDRYVVLERLGSGGMGSVFAAYDTMLDRKVALKFVTVPAAEALTRIVEEASLMAQLQHPNVVTVYDVGRFDDAPYLAMELVNGRDLGAWRQEAPRPVKQVLAVMAQAARGLAAAHRAGLIHRDVKPQNILITADDRRVLVTDFGVSIKAEQTTGARNAGTPTYMAPEQLEGTAVDRRTDSFGFCATLYEMLYGQRPFGDTVYEARERILAGEPKPPPGRSSVPAHIQALVTRGLSVDPEARPADLDAVADHLLANPGARRRKLVAAGAGVALAIGTFWVGGYLADAPERRCLAGASSIDSLFDAGVRARLGAHFTAAARGALWPATERAIGRYLDGWRETYRESCSAVHGERSYSVDVLDRRMDCLNAHRSMLGGLIAGLQAAPAAKLVEGPAAAARLPDVAECQLTGRSEIDRMPSDPASRTRLAEVQELVTRTFTEGLLGDQKKAAATGQQAIAKARQAGYKPLLAQALYRTAMIEGRLGRGDSGDNTPETSEHRARAMFEEAAVVAEQGRDDLRRSEALSELIMANLHLGERREAELYSRQASALIDRLGDPPIERAGYLLNEGWRKRVFGLGDGMAEFRKAIELNDRALKPDDPRRVSALIAVCIGERGPEGRPCYEHALKVSTRLLGAQHPHIGGIHNNLAGILIRDPKTRPEACQLLRKTIAIYEASTDPASLSTLRARADLAQCLREMGETKEPRAIYDDVLAKATKPSMARAHIRQSYGLFLSELGDFEGGARLVRQALDERRSIHGDCHEQVIESVNNLTGDLFRLQRYDQALDELTRAVESCERAQIKPTKLHSLYSQRGFVLQRILRHAEALDMFRKSLAFAQDRSVPEREQHYAYHGIGVANYGLKRYVDAEQALTRSLALRQQEGFPGDQRAEAALSLAAALRSKAGRTAAELDRACQLGQQAIGHFGEAGANWVRQKQVAELWVKTYCKGSKPRPRS